jgi:hypothetical protein
MPRFTSARTSLIALSITALLLTIPRTTPAATGNPQYPFSISVDRGATAFQGGDEIVITDVHGTAKDLKPGNTYQITGDYRLTSQPDATLTAGIVATNGSSRVVSGAQSTNLKNGVGHFSIVLPFTEQGLPRLSIDSSGKNIATINLVAAGFPYTASFIQFDSQMPVGDDINITEIRQSTAAPAPGTMLQIKGTYVLANGAARLTTATTGDIGSPNQSVVINQGMGDFTLLVPIENGKGIQVAFWSLGSGSALASVSCHLGKAQAVPAKPTPIKDIPIMASDSSAPNSAVLFNYTMEIGNGGHAYATENSYTPGQYPFIVPFKIGLTEFLGGDSINISSVRGTAKTIRIGAYYQIRGTYTLSSSSEAVLATYITTVDPKSRDRAMPQQWMEIQHGSGRFNLTLPVRELGWPHLAFYPPNALSDSGTRYFGTGDTVLYSWIQPAPTDMGNGPSR